MTLQDLKRLNPIWRKRLWLGHFAINQSIGRVEDETSLAEPYALPEYQEAKVVWAEGRLQDASEAHFIHEMLHIVVAPLQQTAKELAKTDFERSMIAQRTEAVVTHLTNILRTAYNVPFRDEPKPKKKRRK